MMVCVIQPVRGHEVKHFTAFVLLKEVNLEFKMSKPTLDHMLLHQLHVLRKTAIKLSR